jgi:SAM-dependent methyltransferase
MIELNDLGAEDLAQREAKVWEGSAYYAHAEQWRWVFWADGHPFLPFFEELDVTSVLELACGHGRHSEFLLENHGDKVKSLVMMDILESNVAYCTSRNSARKGVTLHTNNGVDLQPVPDQSLTAAFCYDAMVHFHRSIVRSYLVDLKRVLVPGGKAVLHHSNYALDPDLVFSANPHSRAFMSAALFRKYVTEAGLELVRQDVIPWGSDAQLDCISLVMRPLA